MNIQGVGLKGISVYDNYTPPAPPALWDLKAAATPSSTNLTVTSTYKNFNNGSIVLPGGTTDSYFNINLDYTQTYTIEFWKYITVASSGFDDMFELKCGSNGHWFMQDYTGAVRYSLSGSSSSYASTAGGWGNGSTGSQATGTWVHYIFIFNATSFTWGRNGYLATSKYNWNALCVPIANWTLLRFKDSVYGGTARGWMDEIRITQSDLYNLLNASANATYTIPSSSMTASASTNYLFCTHT